MKKIVLIISLSLVIGCSDTYVTDVTTVLVDDATLARVQQAVIDAYYDVEGVDVTSDQRTALSTFPVNHISGEKFGQIFYTEPNVIGMCTGTDIWVNDELPMDIQLWDLAHEYIHRLMFLTSNDTNTCHENQKVFTCPGSIEERAVAFLGVRDGFRTGYTCGVSSCKAVKVEQVVSDGGTTEDGGDSGDINYPGAKDSGA